MASSCEWRTTRSTEDAMPDSDIPRARSHEGLKLGAIAASVMWIWLLVRDLYAQTPFRTPIYIGSALLSVDPLRSPVPPIVAVIVFTIALYAVWCGVCTLLAKGLRNAARTPSVLIFIVILIILLQLLLIGITTAMAQRHLGPAAWGDLMLGEAIAWCVIGLYVFRTHREIPGELRRLNQGDDA